MFAECACVPTAPLWVVDIGAAVEKDPPRRTQRLTRDPGRCVGLMLAALLSACACSLTLDADRVQCSTDADCTARGSRFTGSTCVDSVCVAEPKWACLDAPAKPSTDPGPFRAPFIVQNLVTQAPLEGVRVNLCRKIDVTCSDPISEELLTDSQGLVTFSVNAGFDGYAYFQGDDIIDGLYFFNPPVAADQPLAMVSIGNAQVTALLALQAGATQDADRGVILLAARDCTGAPAPGVTFTTSGSDEDAIPFYSEQGLPSGTAVQTDSAGYGGLLNASAGSVTFTAKLESTGRTLGQVTLLARAGSITYGSVVPDGG